jgi:hypothetical protein
VDKMNRALFRLLSISIISMMILCSLTSCSGSSKGFTVKESLTAEEVGEVSNGTVNFDGSLSENDGWVYYTIGYSVYKMKIDGTEPTLIKNIDSYFFLISGDWIYYIDSSGYGINRIKKMDRIR